MIRFERFFLGRLLTAQDRRRSFESAVTSSFFESIVELWIANKYEEWLRPLISAITHISCAVYSCSSATEEEILKGNIRLG